MPRMSSCHFLLELLLNNYASETEENPNNLFLSALKLFFLALAEGKRGCFFCMSASVVL